MKSPEPAMIRFDFSRYSTGSEILKQELRRYDQFVDIHREDTTPVTFESVYKDVPITTKKWFKKTTIIDKQLVSVVARYMTEPTVVLNKLPAIRTDSEGTKLTDRWGNYVRTEVTKSNLLTLAREALRVWNERKETKALYGDYPPKKFEVSEPVGLDKS